MVTTSSFATRILSRLNGYSRIDASGLPNSMNEIGLLIDKEKLIGIYHNRGNAQDDMIFVAEAGLAFKEDTQWIYVAYAQIDKVDAGLSDSSSFNKSSLNGLLLQTKAGKKIWLPIDGGNEKFRDAFEFMRFLDRVIKNSSLTK